jgi:hypothetical protein|tara:strand:+ start:119 stop:523 length:405 start_codon:yes stop_codon:yes gene_type:complete
MSNNISILKLRDGATIVAKVTYEGDKYLVEHPIEMVAQASILKQGLGEAINLKPWIAIAEEDVFTIERENVITVATLEEKFVSGYHNMVEAIYFQDPLWGGDFMTEGKQPEGNEDIDIDTLTDLAEAVLKNKIH